LRNLFVRGELSYNSPNQECFCLVCAFFLRAPMTKKLIHTLRPEQLIDLLSIGMDADFSDSGELTSDEGIRDYFDRLVHRKISGESSIVDTILIFLRENDRYGKHVSGHSLSQLLLDPASDVDLYRTVKDYSKKIYQTTVSKGENSIAAAIYYLAIAAALVYHDTAISAHPKSTLKTAFEDLLTKMWMSPEFKELLEAARKRCETEYRA